MRRLSLTIASFTSIMSVPVLFYLGATTLISGSLIVGLLMICVGVSVAIAHSVVFDYVGEKMDVARKEKEYASSLGPESVTRGTPWESDPGHTIE